MDKAKLKKQVCQSIDQRAQDIIAIGRELLHTPELGFKETKSAAYVAKVLRSLGLQPRKGLALTGVKAVLKGSAPGPSVAVIGELDALFGYGHPDANSRTGAVHNCGHNAQLAAMLGVGMGLVDAGAMDHLAGQVVFLAVPAEEYVEIEYRETLRQAGKIEFLGGKSELVRLGAFDDIDMAMLVHALPNVPEHKFVVGGTMNGFIAKRVRFLGKAAHAGARPDQGVNALNAAALAIMGIHTQRETFREEESVRVHFIMTKGGDLVNIVPEDVRMEMFVRAKSLESIRKASTKVDRALRGAAAMVGAEVEIDDLVGYLPLLQDEMLVSVFRENALTLVGEDNVRPGRHVTASTDAGDLSHLMPVVHPSGGGYEGITHGEDFCVVDEEMAYVTPAKAMAMTAIDLLYEDAAFGRRVLQIHEPQMTKDEYLSYLRGEDLAAPQCPKGL